uniref:Ig-like domain-containing protein n=1 Tax=Cyprinus carpio TaxID=7962 RepID=A0A8C1T543_CYPCA
LKLIVVSTLNLIQLSSLKEDIHLVRREGESAEIFCPYDSIYKSKPKSLCKGKCSTRDRNPLSETVREEKETKTDRLTLKDDVTASVFTGSITALTAEDAGKYWCAVTLETELNYLHTHLMDEWMENGDVSLYNDTRAGVLMVFFRELKAADAGTYRCGVKESDYTESFTELQLSVKHGEEQKILYIVCIAKVFVLIFLQFLLVYRCKISKERDRICSFWNAQNNSNMTFKSKCIHIQYNTTEKNTDNPSYVFVKCLKISIYINFPRCM